MSTTSLGVWEESNYTSFMLWDIDREFQNACEAYEQMMAKSRRRKTRWQCIAGSKKEDPLEEALSLGRQVQKVFKEGKALFGSRFEKGDCTSIHSFLIYIYIYWSLTFHPNSDMPHHPFRPTPPPPTRNPRPPPRLHRTPYPPLPHLPAHRHPPPRRPQHPPRNPPRPPRPNITPKITPNSHYPPTATLLHRVLPLRHPTTNRPPETKPKPP
jgi:hypothetical protein